MAHLYKAKEWQSGSGQWYVNDVEELTGVASKWYTPPRLLEMSLTDYVTMLKEDFKVDEIKLTKTNLLIFSWNANNGHMAHKYVLWINKQSRNNNWVV